MVSLRRAGFLLENSQDYLLSFDAYADKPVSMDARLLLRDDPWTEYHRLSETLSTAKQSYSYSFDVPTFIDAGASLDFYLGGEANAQFSPYKVCLDNITLALAGDA